jgi:hypothetical protein
MEGFSSLLPPPSHFFCGGGWVVFLCSLRLPWTLDLFSLAFLSAGITGMCYHAQLITDFKNI